MNDLQNRKEELQNKLKKEIDENIAEAYFSEDDIVKKFYVWCKKAKDFYNQEIDTSSGQLGEMLLYSQLKDRGCFPWEEFDKENPLEHLKNEYWSDPEIMLQVFRHSCDQFVDYYDMTAEEKLCVYYQKEGTYDENKNYYEELSKMDYETFYKCRAFENFKYIKDHRSTRDEAQEIFDIANKKLNEFNKKEELER